MINAILSAAMLAVTTVYRLELVDEVPFVVGEDGVRRQVMLVDPAEYSAMTGKVDQVWKSLNATDEGRVKLHGKRVGTEVDEKAGKKYVVYEDGYRFGTKFVKRVASDRTQRPAPEMSARRRAYEEALKARKARKQREMTVVKEVK